MIAPEGGKDGSGGILTPRPPWVWGTVGAVLVLALLIPLISPLITPPKYDEFIIVYDAQRLVNGQVPFRDYFSFLPPGTYYLLALAYLPFGGGSLTVARYATLGFVLTGWWLLWMGLRRSGWPAAEALPLSLMYPMCLYPFWPVPSHHWVALLCCAAFFWAVAGGNWARTTRGHVLVGALVGAALAVLQTEGIYLALASAVLLALAFKDGTRGPIVRGALSGGLGAASVLALAYGPLLLLGAGPAMVQDLLVWPARNYNKPGNDNARLLLEDLPVRFQRLWSESLDLGQPMRAAVASAGALMLVLLLLATVACLACALAVLAHAGRARTLPPPASSAACAVTLAACFLYMKGRPDLLHMLYPLAAGGGLWLLALGGIPERVNLRKAVVLSAGILVLSGALYHGRRPLAHAPGLGELVDVDGPVRDYVVNRFLRDPKVLPIGESVAAFPEGGEVYLYGPKPATGFTLLFPLDAGLNDLGDHERAAQEMKKNRPLWIILRPDMEKGFLDQASPVGRMLAEQYIRRGGLGAAVLYQRKS